MTSVSPRRLWRVGQGFQGPPQFRAELDPKEQVNQTHRSCAEGLLSAMTRVGAQAGGAEDACGAMSGEAQAARGDHQSCLEGWLPDSGPGLCWGFRALPRPGAKGQGDGRQDSRTTGLTAPSLILVSFHFGLCVPSPCKQVWPCGQPMTGRGPSFLGGHLGSMDTECMWLVWPRRGVRSPSSCPWHGPS